MGKKFVILKGIVNVYNPIGRKQIGENCNDKGQNKLLINHTTFSTEHRFHLKILVDISIPHSNQNTVLTRRG